ncbi:putative sugar nucleotidyl transferase [Larkinella terrae]|uniref:Glucose-1-phosphate thymidylyltransferase n=1 Tax=Larkinella terrae TaxID=2025311 RepID=A0A7K0EEA3_9BACT|nr:putative sugar nucleotidyl transferase [Larkinella terrae]MRS60153.1 glucose-1-phosphate thymidylyltransferase [Larkinella terrae]
MYNLILFDDPTIRTALLPFTFTRPVSEIRIGIWTITEKWVNRLKTTPSFLTELYLQIKYAVQPIHDSFFVNGAVCPTNALIDALNGLPPDGALVTPDGLLLAFRSEKPLESVPLIGDAVSVRVFEEPLTIIKSLPDIYASNADQIRADFEFLTAGRSSQPITDPHTRCYAPENIFVEEGAVIRAAVLNAENGPIYIGKNALIQEGSVLLGPFALCDHATVNWGGKMRSNTTIGPYTKVGGEISNTVFFGYSNKGHDGFLGNSVIGEWCNLGANTNNSNLKNDYTNVNLYSYATGGFENTGRLFCGLMMGDYTKVGISTMFNTGTVVGVNVNVFGGGFQPKYIPSFSWGGGAEGFTDYRLDKALQVARETIGRRGLVFDEVEEAVLREVHRIEAGRSKGGEDAGN